MQIDQKVKNFYDVLQFPGHYTRQDLEYHIPVTRNFFLKYLEQGIKESKEIADLGCGTGLIANLFAIKNHNKKFSSVDFSDSINYAKKFAKDNFIDNVTFFQEDLRYFSPVEMYDTVICQGVLHHIPEYHLVVENITRMVKPDGLVHIGVYHPFGKLIKKFYTLDYFSAILEEDQERNPWETSYTRKQIINMFSNFDLLGSTSNYQFLDALSAISRSKSGGLIIYTLRKRSR